MPWSTWKCENGDVQDVRSEKAPAIPTFPPSVAVVCHGRMDAQDTYMDVGGRVVQEQLPSDVVNSIRCDLISVIPT